MPPPMMRVDGVFSSRLLEWRLSEKRVFGKTVG
jgi:hypothetical protein